MAQGVLPVESLIINENNDNTVFFICFALVCWKMQADLSNSVVSICCIMKARRSQLDSFL